MSLMARLLREPLVHFFVLGAAFFLVYGMLSGPRPAPADTIIVGPDQIAQLKAGYESVWKRSPTDDELRAMIDGYVREEVYYREALALGLERDDAVVRRRLQQKMEFLTDTGADLVEPSRQDLETYFAANGPKYRREPRLAFEQLYLGETASPAEVARAMDALRSQDPGAAAAMGKPTLLPGTVGLSTPAQLAGIFGDGLFEQLAAFPAGEWSGPVTSGYGVHLVRVTQGEPAAMPPLDEVIDTVRRDWKEARTLEMREQHFARLRQRYAVEILDDGPAVDR